MTRVVAFDIDGTLTEPRVRAKFRELSEREDTFVGVISSRTPAEAIRFIKEHNIQIDFEEMGFFKTVPLLRQKAGFFFVGEEFIYVGNTPRDAFASFVTGWEFVSSDEIDERF